MTGNHFRFKHAILFLGTLILAACGGSDSNSNSPTLSDVSLSFSDAPVDSAQEVVIEVDSITFRGNGEDIVVDTFTSEALDLDGADTFQLDLLSVRGPDSRLVIDSVDLPVGEYSSMLIDIIDEDTTSSYVTEVSEDPEVEGLRKELKVPSDQLKLGSFTIDPLSTQSLVVEFDLGQSMTYNPGPDRYILKPRGVRIVSVDSAAQIAGAIDHDALMAAGCTELDEGGISGRVYLHPAIKVEGESLVDNFEPDGEAETVDLIAPYASEPLASSSYVFSFVEPGDYVLSVGCSLVSDDPDLLQLEDITLPNPTGQQASVNLIDGTSFTCDIPIPSIGDACSDAAVADE